MSVVAYNLRALVILLAVHLGIAFLTFNAWTQAIATDGFVEQTLIRAEWRTAMTGIARQNVIAAARDQTSETFLWMSLAAVFVSLVWFVVGVAKRVAVPEQVLPMRGMWWMIFLSGGAIALGVFVTTFWSRTTYMSTLGFEISFGYGMLTYIVSFFLATLLGSPLVTYPAVPLGGNVVRW